VRFFLYSFAERMEQPPHHHREIIL
jgi:hypothetical protein